MSTLSTMHCFTKSCALTRRQWCSDLTVERCGDMLTFYVFVFTLGPFSTSAEYESFFTNGWTPLSSDTIYNQIRRTYTQPPALTTTGKAFQYVQDNHEIRREESNNKCKDAATCSGDKIVTTTELHLQSDFVPNVLRLLPIRNTTVDVRKSKKISDQNFKNDVALPLVEEESVSKNKLITYSYEVTENVNTEDLLQPEEAKIKLEGYKYEPPIKKNQANGFINILSKYNIKVDDELTNYALSRRPKALNQNVLHKPIQIGAPNRYNNLNHLSVDPLLAVFLSNYGYYIRGLYGIQNNYNNLYGYLASNNIHNNRPFGFYKLFSDTDSSH